MISTWLQRTTNLGTSNLFQWALIFIGVIIGGGLLVWAVNLAIANFVSDPWKPKVQALFYIVVALICAALVLHWTGLI
jgi:hypothetical protein